ncbi:hypothetical protein HD842_002356 [Massilia aurea]|uniref:Uncharacterized protein n=1 Tax=Massilia aurea TaxID=373040 RepID=A0A7W9X0I9_9BURK|nr:hypothetical protein [Massilia aurea]MBB6134214.1 hypothetical protein [Massilia aurea]
MFSARRLAGSPLIASCASCAALPVAPRAFAFDHIEVSDVWGL